MNDYQAYPGHHQYIPGNALMTNLETLERNGFYVVNGVFSEMELARFRQKIDRCWERQLSHYGADLLQKIGDYGMVRAMMAEDPDFLQLIAHPAILEHVNATVGETAILHLQNGIVLHPGKKHNQARYHKDFPKDFISTKLISFNALIAIDAFDAVTGGTWIVPGSHRFAEMPSEQYIEKNAIQLVAPAGAVVFFDSHLWHKGGANRTNQIRRAINQQYTRPFIKQQLDYPAFLSSVVDPESKLAQLLGFWSRPPKGVAEYRVGDPSQRTYRAGQG